MQVFVINCFWSNDAAKSKTTDGVETQDCG